MSHFLPLALRLQLQRRGFTQKDGYLKMGGYSLSFHFCKELAMVPLEDVPLALADYATCMSRTTYSVFEADTIRMNEAFEGIIKPFLACRLEAGI